MGRLDGKVAVISGAARGQGRAHAVRLAAEGADIVAFDICSNLAYPLTPPASPEDLKETAAQVEALDRRCLSRVTDARDLTSLTALADEAVAEFGRVDALVVNHGIWTVDRNSWELPEESWQESIDVLLTGSWKVQKAFVPKIVAGARGGAVVFTSSVNAVVPQPGAVAYCAAKSGIQMLMKVLARELGPHDIRVNTVNPGSVSTAMHEGGTIERSLEYFPRGLDRGARAALEGSQTLPPSAIADAVAWLVSDEARYVTGALIPVDSGFLTG
ncbi:mycofactocin-coupled SDR family oxidoreductase [Pseudonocardia xishanensis]|uniref:Mycofactocin-coupled SDR family oxidoreductase n=1 Tax=Pseudonocardia xishanensis TaxID=630995 RepID=A0ABP8RVJ9_9PSEU